MKMFGLKPLIYVGSATDADQRFPPYMECSIGFRIRGKDGTADWSLHALAPAV